MTEPDALFAPPVAAPLRRPGDLEQGTGKVTYSKLLLKNPTRCDDCVMVAYESNRGGDHAEPIRTARFTRVQDGTTKRYLCSEHKQLREQHENRPEGVRRLGA